MEETNSQLPFGEHSNGGCDGEGIADGTATTSTDGENEVAFENDPHDREESKNFEAVVNAFRYYKRGSIKQLAGRTASFRNLPAAHQNLLEAGLVAHTLKVRQCIAENYGLLRSIVANVGGIFENRDHNDDVEASQKRPASEHFMEKLRSTLRQIVRDWSEDGIAERKTSYGHVLDALDQRFSAVSNKADVRVLVPGAGLGRLTWEAALRGYSSQGNEFSLFMLFVSNFVLNQCSQTCNSLSYEDRVRPIRFPDVDPTSLPQSGNTFSMAAGDFMDIYSTSEHVCNWDAVLTVFFIDTASNIVSYIELISKILKQGGVPIGHGHGLIN